MSSPPSSTDKEEETDEQEEKDKGPEYVPQVIYVDRHMKRCRKNNPEGARRATYNQQYELYVIDH